MTFVWLRQVRKCVIHNSFKCKNIRTQVELSLLPAVEKTTTLV